ncbi:YlbL family protein [Salininema proteolyticum]|uniref:PDZ domain-containing protein n=1 Tax=Salininema proteolyticum TaxID=1607685 RepID=A0ABV8TYH9_9ACTN
MMKRRGITVMIGAALVALLTWQVLGMNVAYVAMTPGKTVDVLSSQTGEDGEDHQIITADKEYPTDGELRLTTVSVYQQVSIAEALRLWFSDEVAVVPRELVYPPGLSKEEIAEKQENDWVTSQSDAEQAALDHLGQPLTVEVTADAGDLREGDVLVELGGEKVESTEQVEALAGEEVDAKVNRAGKEEEVSGVDPAAVELEFTHRDPYNIQIDTEALDIGGPSAGLMFTLGIVDRVTPDSLTGGEDVAGTGTITAGGKVGPIGGVQQKIAAVDEAGIELFLTPADNCSEAKGAAEGTGVQLARVDTLDDAVAAVEAYAKGDPLPRTC